MPHVSQWFVRSSLVSLLTGFTLGAALLAQRGLGGADGAAALLWRWRPAHVELLLVGWMVQLVMGVALWILPRFGVHRSLWAGPAAWLAFAFLNLGVLLAAVGPALGGPGGGALLAAGRAAEIAAALAFASALWPRVRASGLSEM
jgi:cbb3-type cytochrome oxidase subunit 1